MHHSTFVEIGGNALNYSLNYEYKVLLSPNSKFAFRTGFSAYPIVNKDIDFILLPGINLLIGNEHNLELGANIGYCIAQTTNFVIPSATIGYRFQSKNGLLFRADFFRIFHLTLIIILILKEAFHSVIHSRQKNLCTKQKLRSSNEYGF